jgi:hypothetical protein
MIALGGLLISPMAWGCDGAGGQNCRMSNCPMNDQQSAHGCPQSETSPEHSSMGCAAGQEMGIACCDAPGDLEPATVDSESSRDRGTTQLVVLAEQAELQLPVRPPDLVSEAISSQQHELGRFTLLSTFLL